jgi:hypothetical protein
MSYVGSDLWQLLRTKGYQLNLVPYTDWYQKVKEAAASASEHSRPLTSLLYLLDAVTYVAGSKSSVYISLPFPIVSSFKLQTLQSIKTTVFWDVAPCGLVDVY